MKFLLWIMALLYACPLLAQTPAPTAASSIPVPPEALPWYGEMVLNLLGQFPDANGWLVVAFVALSAIIQAAVTVLQAVEDKTGKASKYMLPVNRLAMWAKKLLEWTNKPTLKKKRQDE